MTDRESERDWHDEDEHATLLSVTNPVSLGVGSFSQRSLPRKLAVVGCVSLLGLACFAISALVGTSGNTDESHGAPSPDSALLSSAGVSQSSDASKIVMFESDKDVLCDDLTPLKANGCCSNDKCPSSCGSKSVGLSKGVTKCQCQHCEPPSAEADEAACGNDDEDDRRLGAPPPGPMRNGGNAMRKLSREAKFLNCMLGRAMSRGQQVLQAQLNLSAADHKGLELLGMLASGAAAPPPAGLVAGAGAPPRKLFFGIGAGVSAAGNFFASAGQNAAHGVTQLVKSIANIDKYFCPLLMPMCDCDDPKSKPPSWVGGNFEAECVLGGSFAKESQPFKKEVKLCDKSSLLGSCQGSASATLGLSLSLKPEFGMKLSSAGGLHLTTRSVAKGRATVDIHAQGNISATRTFKLPGTPINKTSCFYVNGFPACVIVMLSLSAKLDVAGEVIGSMKPSFDIDAVFSGSVDVPFPLGRATAVIDKNHAKLTEAFDLDLNMDASARLTLSPELAIFPLPAIVSVGTYAKAEVIAAGELKFNPSFTQEFVGGHWQKHGLHTQVDLGRFHHKRGMALNAWWESEVTVAGLPDVLRAVFKDSFFDFLQSMLDASVEELRERIVKLADKAVPSALKSVVVSFLDMLKKGANIVVGELMKKLKARLPVLDSLPAGWQYKPPPHMCNAKTWGTYEKSKGVCPVKFSE